MTFDVNKWLEEGRAHKDQLPEGVVLPEPEIDYEAYREALQAFYDVRPYESVVDRPFSPLDEGLTRGIIAAWEHMPETKALKAPQPDADGWVEHTGNACPPGLEDKMVEVILRDYDGSRAGERRLLGRHWSWEIDGVSGDITHYRVVKED